MKKKQKEENLELYRKQQELFYNNKNYSTNKSHILSIIMPCSEECMESLHIKRGSAEALTLCGEGVRVDSVHDGSKVPFPLAPQVHHCQIQVGKDPQVTVLGGLE